MPKKKQQRACYYPGKVWRGHLKYDRLTQRHSSHMHLGKHYPVPHWALLHQIVLNGTKPWPPKNPKGEFYWFPGLALAICLTLVQLPSSEKSLFTCLHFLSSRLQVKSALSILLDRRTIKSHNTLSSSNKLGCSIGTTALLGYLPGKWFRLMLLNGHDYSLIRV